MIFIILALSFITIFIGLILLWLMSIQKRRYGILSGNRIYSDTSTKPGEVLYSNRLNLVGKPDYLIKEKNTIIPVEIKTGKTPDSPYPNHIVQLMAYCLLVEENFGIKPPGGYLKYPEKEFHIAYTSDAEESLKDLVREILEKKQSGEELNCDHKEHYFNL